MACAGNRGESACPVAAGALDGIAVRCVAIHAHRFHSAEAAREKVGKMIAVKAVHGVASDFPAHCSAMARAMPGNVLALFLARSLPPFCSISQHVFLIFPLD